jgi:nicotinamidase-related amidase
MQGAARIRSTHRSPGCTALLLIDFINALDFDGGACFAPAAMRAAKATARLRHRLGRKVITIYANDNFGDWTSDLHRVVANCTARGSQGAAMSHLLAPRDGDLFVLKPRHSAFFQTPLDILLESLDVRRLILTGLSTDMCVLFTANDAYVRGFQIVVPPRCTAALTPARHREALGYMKRVCKAAAEP